MLTSISISSITVAALAVFTVSCLATAVVRRYSLRHAILDIPNERSSHTIPTPRGGGLAFASVFLVSLVLVSHNGWLPLDESMALAGGLAIMLTGWLDDLLNLSAWLRLLVHLASASWAVYWIWGPESLVLCLSNPAGFLKPLLVVFGITWMINLFNFMDGIDGLAASEVIIVSGCAGFAMICQGYLAMGAVSVILAGSVTGFIIWNWPPAQIFMGDAGSGFLGYTIAILALLSDDSGGLQLQIWVILLAVFLVDATGTLIIRIIKGDKWWLPHREHLYQKAVMKGYTHRRVTLVAIAVNLILAAVSLAILYNNEVSSYFLALAAFILVSLYTMVRFRLSKQ